MSALPSFPGSCHCGALGYSFHTALPVSRWSVRACQCSFCRAHHALTTSDPEGRLIFEVRADDALQRYRFGLRTADFLVCRRCGVYLGAQIATPGGAFGIVNVRALSSVPPQLPAAAHADYGAETPGERVARRTERWTPLESIV